VPLSRTLSVTLAAVLGLSGALLIAPLSAAAAPTSVTVFGSFQSELGCASDFVPDCATTHLTAVAGGWSGTFVLPAGTYGYKIAIDDALDEVYGAGAASPGDNMSFTTAGGPVSFVYDENTHVTADSISGPIVIVPGDFQSELGCASDFMPDCLLSWLQDADGDGTFTRTVTDVPVGDYHGKVAHNLSFTENYGAGGVPGGVEIPFTVPTAGLAVHFSYDLATHILTITVGDPVTPPGSGPPAIAATGASAPVGALGVVAALLALGALLLSVGRKRQTA
jgi:pullulanase-like protein